MPSGQQEPDQQRRAEPEIPDLIPSGSKENSLDYGIQGQKRDRPPEARPRQQSEEERQQAD